MNTRRFLTGILLAVVIALLVGEAYAAPKNTCTLPYPTRMPAGWSVTSVQSLGAVPSINVFPPLAQGGETLIKGTFPGITPYAYTTSQGPINLAQGLYGFVDDPCHPIKWSSLSSQYFNIVLPIGYNGSRLYLCNADGTFYNAQINEQQYSPVFQWTNLTQYDVPNGVVAQFFIRPLGSGGAWTYWGVVQNGYPISPGIPHNYEIGFYFLTTGAFIDGNTPPITALFDETYPLAVTAANGILASPPGSTNVLIVVTPNFWGINGVHTVSYSVGANKVPIIAQLQFN